MAMKRFFIGCCLLLLTVIAFGQQYFRLIDDPDNYFNQKIARFPDGDILIVDSSLEAQRTGGDGLIYATRIDECGSTVWATTYEHDAYIEFKDVVISNLGEVFIYCSEYVGLNENVFLFKLDETGDLLRAKSFAPSSVDHFSYSIDIREGAVIMYGLQFDFNSQKQGFLIKLDEELNVQWNRAFEPFESTGAAIIKSDGGVIGYSGVFHISLNAAGDLEWANQINLANSIKIVSGPLEVEGGFLFEGHSDNQSFLYKLDGNGNLIWKSDLFLAQANGGSLSLLENQDILFTYIRPDGNADFPCFLRLSTDGFFIEQQQFRTDLPLFAQTVYHTVHNDQWVSLVGNADPRRVAGIQKLNFLMQFKLGEDVRECFDIATTIAPEMNTLSFDLLPLELNNFENTGWQQQVRSIKKRDTEDYFRAYCGTTIERIVLDTFLNCEADWLVELPSADFFWEDGHSSTTRLLSKAGVYKAANRATCGSGLDIEFRIDKPFCSCSWYVPTAFSPNGDGVNDELSIFNNCEDESFQYHIFNRWGQLVYEGKTANQTWDGKSQQRKVPEGIYIIQVFHDQVSETGTTTTVSFSQAVTLVR